MTRIGVVGAGYVGTTAAACFAHLGHDVVCADVSEDRIRELRKGEVGILERSLPVLVTEGLESGRLVFEVGARRAAEGTAFVFLCLPTPSADGGAVDLSALEAAAREIGPVLEPDAVVVVKSTAPVGATRRVRRVLDADGAPPGVSVASNPEFLREGNSVEDFLHPDRIVIGCDEPETAVRLTGLYSGVPAPVVVTDPASAEMVKYASNAYLAGRVSFINAVANLCEAVGADVRDVALGMGYDPRIGSDFLHPGPGFGGSCLPKDTAALLHIAAEAGVDLPPVEATVAVNTRQRERVVEKILAALDRAPPGSPVAAWGLTFKANTDDLRDSPALDIVRALLARGVTVRAFDPVAGERAGGLEPGLDVTVDPYDACDGAAVLAVLTEWEQFRWLDFARVAELMAVPQVVDTRNLLDPPTMRRLGFDYQGVGR